VTVTQSTSQQVDSEVSRKPSILVYINVVLYMKQVLEKNSVKSINCLAIVSQTS